MGTYPDSWFRFQGVPPFLPNCAASEATSLRAKWSPSMNCTRMFAFILVSSQECCLIRRRHEH